MIKAQQEQLLVQGQLIDLFQFKKRKTYLLLSENLFKSMNLIYNQIKTELIQKQKVGIVDCISRIRLEELRKSIPIKLFEGIAKKSIYYYHPIIHDYSEFRKKPFERLKEKLRVTSFTLVIEPSIVFYTPLSCLISTKEDIDAQYYSFLREISKETEKVNNISLIFDREDSPLYSIAIFSQFDEFKEILEKIVIARYDDYTPEYTGYDTID